MEESELKTTIDYVPAGKKKAKQSAPAPKADSSPLPWGDL